MQNKDHKRRGGVSMYFISIIAVILGTCLMCFFGGGGANGLVSLIDGMSFLILLVLTVPMLVASGLLKDFNSAFRLSVSKNKIKNMGEIKRAIEAVDLVMKVLITAGVFVAICSFTLIIATLDDPSTLGPKVGVAVISLMYALAMNLFLLPLKSRLKIRLQEYMEEA